MKRWIKFLLLALLIILILIILYSISSTLFKPLCGTPFEVRDAQTGECKIYVGCSLPKGMVEDPTCIEELRQEIENSTLLRVCPDRIIIDGSLCITTNNSSCPPKFDTEYKINDQIVNKSKYDLEWVENNCRDRRVYMD